MTGGAMTKRAKRTKHVVAKLQPTFDISMEPSIMEVKNETTAVFPIRQALH